MTRRYWVVAWPTRVLTLVRGSAKSLAADLLRIVVPCAAVVGLLIGLAEASSSGGPGVRSARGVAHVAAPGTLRGSLTTVSARPAPADAVAAGLHPAPDQPSIVSSSGATASARVAGVSLLAGDGIPAVALAAYRNAAAATARSNPGCHLAWSLLAGIGRVESDHGRFAGAQLRTDGTSTIKIVGIALDGIRTALIRDTDRGRLDGDVVYDRAVGPMQFIPTTWTTWGVDADSDGAANPFDIDDAALAAAHYLCAAGGNLATSSGRVRAVLAYNHSSSYVAEVLALAAAYATGHPVAITPVRSVPLPTIAPVDPGRPPALPVPAAPARSAAEPSRPATTSTHAASPSTIPVTNAHPSTSVAATPSDTCSNPPPAESPSSTATPSVPDSTVPVTPSDVATDPSTDAGTTGSASTGTSSSTGNPGSGSTGSSSPSGSTGSSSTGARCPGTTASPATSASSSAVPVPSAATAGSAGAVVAFAFAALAFLARRRRGRHVLFVG